MQFVWCARCLSKWTVQFVHYYEWLQSRAIDKIAWKCFRLETSETDTFWNLHTANGVNTTTLRLALVIKSLCVQISVFVQWIKICRKISLVFTKIFEWSNHFIGFTFNLLKLPNKFQYKPVRIDLVTHAMSTNKLSWIWGAGIFC